MTRKDEWIQTLKESAWTYLWIILGALALADLGFLLNWLRGL